MPAAGGGAGGLICFAGAGAAVDGEELGAGDAGGDAAGGAAGIERVYGIGRGVEAAAGERTPPPTVTAGPRRRVPGEPPPFDTCATDA
jgi:hypothetical protein